MMNPRSSSNRILTGLLGAPIAHSASPAMHERAAEALDLRCHYQLVEVAGAGREKLKVLLEGVRRLGFAGINVTFPCKEAVVDLPDEVSPGAAEIGAVNTVVVGDDRLIGHDTETTGFEQNARSALEIFGIVLELGQTRLVDKAERVLNDPRIGQLFLGGAMTESAA